MPVRIAELFSNNQTNNLKMKKIIFIVFSLLYINSCGQWVVISTQGNQAVSFPSAFTGYSTTNGLTRKTTNGGYNWSTISSGNMTGIFFINNMTGWIVGYPGYIGRTTSGGTFTQQQTGISDRLNDVFFINENTGWVVGGDFSVERIFYTTNGGVNWTVQTSNTANKLFSVYFIDENTGWSVGGPSSPKIIKTTNSGQNWFTQYTDITTPLYSVMFAGANTGWAVAGYLGGETIIKTTNGGNNWFSQSSGDNRYLRECYVKDSLKMIAVGQGGKIIVTSNGGNNWTIVSTGSTVELWSIDFANDSIGYATGSNIVLKTTNGGLTFVNKNKDITTDRYKLYQNYPNPFNQSTVINYELAEPCEVLIKIYDITGKETSVLVNDYKSPGVYSVNLNTIQKKNVSVLSGGIYFYSLYINGKLANIKKMIYIK